jgi:hypothetical protein
MFNLFKRQVKKKVWVIFYDGDLINYGHILSELAFYFTAKYSELSFTYIYSDKNNIDRKGKITTFPNLDRGDFTMVVIFSGKELDSESGISFGFYQQEDSITVFHCIMPEYIELDFEDIIQCIGHLHFMRYGYSYFANLNNTPNGYMLNSWDANKSVQDLPKERLVKSKMLCFRANRKLLLNDVIKDVFNDNLLSKKHFERIKSSRFYAFLLDSDVSIRMLDSEVFLIKFSNNKILDTARKIAYKEKIVLCS